MLESLTVTRRLTGDLKLLVNDVREIETKEYRLSSFLFGCRLNVLCGSGTVFASSNLLTSLQEEVGFYRDSESVDTLIPNIQGALKAWCM
jgi:hypothetical protein